MSRGEYEEMGVLKEFYTIREVSSIAGVTVQSVYSRLEKAEKDTGRTYCTVGEDKVKRVSADFLRDCYGITGDEDEEARKLDIVARLEAELERERERSSAEISRLTAEIDRLHSEIDKLLQMNLNNQVLLLQTKPDPLTEPADAERAEESSEPEPIKKKGFFDLFRKDK